MPTAKKNGHPRRLVRRKSGPVRAQRVQTKSQVIRLLRREMPHLHEKYGVTGFRFFGSFVKGTAKKSSDVDLLVEFEKPLGLQFVALAIELEKTLGRKVDVATFSAWRRSLSNPRRRSIAEDIERTLVYVQ